MNYLPLIEILSHFIKEESADMCSDYEHAVNATEKLTKTLSTSNLTRMCKKEDPLDLNVHEIHMKLHPHKVTDRSLTYIHAIWDSLSSHLCIPGIKAVIDAMPSVDAEADCLCATLPHNL